MGTVAAEMDEGNQVQVSWFRGEPESERPIEAARRRSEALREEMSKEPFAVDPHCRWFMGDPNNAKISVAQAEGIQNEARDDRCRHQTELVEGTSRYDLRINWLLEQSSLGQPLQDEAASRAGLDSELWEEKELQQIRESMRARISATEELSKESPRIQESAREYVERMRSEAHELPTPGPSAAFICTTTPCSSARSIAPPNYVARVRHTSSQEFITHMHDTNAIDQEFNRVARMKAALGGTSDGLDDVSLGGHISSSARQQAEDRERDAFSEAREKMASFAKILKKEPHVAPGSYPFPPMLDSEERRQ